MKWIAVVVVALLIGIGIGIAYQKGKPVPPPPRVPIALWVGGVSQKVLLNPQPGDIIQWFDAKGHTLPPGWAPKWHFDSPCDPKDKGAECHVQPSADHNLYAYDCPPGTVCDPEVPVGSDVVITGQSQVAAMSRISGYPFYIGCQGGVNVAVEPNPAPVAASDSAVAWEGLIQVKKWTVDTFTDKDGHPANVCTVASLDQDHAVCTLDSSLKAGLYHYRADTKGACTQSPAGVFDLDVKR